MYFVFSPEGKLARKFNVDSVHEQLMIQLFEDGEFWIQSDENISRDTHYYDGANTVRIRRIISGQPNKLDLVADNTDEFVLSGLPIPCSVFIDGVESEITDGTLEFVVPVAGTYQVVAGKFPDVPQTFTVVAT